MSHRGINPNDYEYDGSESIEEAVESAKVAPRAARFRATTAVTTAVLAAAGLVGGAAFALTNSSGELGSDALPMVQIPAGESGVNPAAAPSQVATPAATPTTDLSASQGATGGKTIAVPPAAFEDKNGERDFHGGSKPAASSNPGATATPGATVAPPNFGGGDDGHDGHEGGDRHHRTPTPGSTGLPSFNNDDEDD